jgi:hypothetical protein
VRADGAGLVWVGYLGGSEDDWGVGIALDGLGAVYVTGFTASSAATFPVTVGPGTSLGGTLDAFVAKLSEVPDVVTIDIKPGSFPNSINPRSRGRIPVAVLSSATFDAPGTVDPASLTFGRTGDEPSLGFCNTQGEDVNGDGRLDLVCHFETPLTGFVAGDVQGTLKGQTLDTFPIVGTDSVRIVPGG